jgi:arginine-tRNA-protein transferase
VRDRIELQLFSHYPASPPPVRARLMTLPPHECPYLPGRLARNRAFLAERLEPATYDRFMDAGFRRSGQVIYQPVCHGCRACVPIRVPVDRFHPSKTQRRCWRRNQDLVVSIDDSPTADDESFALYVRYMTQWHDEHGSSTTSRDDFICFLYESPVRTLEFKYRDPTGRLLAVGICDVSDRALSSVYFYFDPEHRRRGLGTFGALYEIEHARREKLEHYYLGYWVADCAAMSYKASFRPHEFLGTDGVWRPGANASQQLAQENGGNEGCTSARPVA